MLASSIGAPSCRGEQDGGVKYPDRSVTNLDFALDQHVLFGDRGSQNIIQNHFDDSLDLLHGKSKLFVAAQSNNKICFECIFLGFVKQLKRIKDCEYSAPRAYYPDY